MATPQPNQRRLIITGKGKPGSISGTDGRTIEQWANSFPGGIQEIVAGSNITVEDPEGPVVTISSSGGSGGYASLTGTGETTTPGDLTQAGGFDVEDTTGDGITLNSYMSGAIGIGINRGGSSGGAFTVDNNGGDPTIFLDDTALGLSVGSGGTTVTLSTSGLSLVSGAHSVLIQSNLITLEDNASTKIIKIGATSGSQIGLGFWGVVPILQPSAPTTLADVIAILTNYGLCA